MAVTAGHVEATTMTHKIKHGVRKRYRVLYLATSSSLALVFVIIGMGYLAGGTKATAATATFSILTGVTGSLHTHGAVMAICGIWVIIGNCFGKNHPNVTRFGLIVTSFYATFVAYCLFANWFFVDISFPTPWWYVLVMVLSLTLLVLGSPSDTDEENQNHVSCEGEPWSSTSPPLSH